MPHAYMKLSHRIANLLPDGDDGWEIYRRACAMRDAGQPVTMLTIGEHDHRIVGAHIAIDRNPVE